MQSDINLNNSNLTSIQENTNNSPHFIKIDYQISDLFKKIINLISNSPNKLDQETQEEIAKILNLLHKIKRIAASKKFLNNHKKQSEIETLLLNLSIAIQSIPNKQQFFLIKKIRSNAEFDIRKLENSWLGFALNFCHRFLSGVAIKIVIGLLFAIPLYIGMPIALFSSSEFIKEVLITKGIVSTNEQSRNNDTPDIYIKDFDMMIWLGTLCFIAGSTGSIISILSRLDNYRAIQKNQEYKDSILPILVGFLKPIIGGTFGLLIFAILEGGIIPLEFGQTDNQKRQDLRWMSLYSLAFVTGFSERLAKDLINRTEKQFDYTNNVNSPAQISPQYYETSSPSNSLEDNQNNNGNQ